MANSHTNFTTIRKPQNPFNVMLVGHIQNKTQITEILSSYSSSEGFVLQLINDIGFIIRNLSSQARFKNMVDHYYGTAQAIIIFSNNDHDFSTRFTEIVSVNSQCSIGVVSNDGSVLTKAKEAGLFCMDPTISSLNSFLLMIYTLSQQKRVIPWDNSQTGDYYAAILKGFLNICIQTGDNVGNDVSKLQHS